MKLRLYSTAALTLLLSIEASPQGTTAKPKASEYPVHQKTPDVEIGAEYMVRSFGADQLLLADDFLVVEVAIYPADRDGFKIDTRQFTMRINSRKQVLFPQSPGMVAASLKYSD